MRLLLKLAWRNILRNKRRTFIAGTAIGVGLAAMIFVDALFQGMDRYMIRSATASFLGEAQIHRKGFRESFDAGFTIGRLDETLAALDASPLVRRYSVRAVSSAMISSAANATGVSLFGVEPDAETHLSLIDDSIVQGDFFDGDDARDIVIGSKLAELLEVELGDRIVVTASQAHTDDLAQELFRVSGVYHFNIPDMDKGMAFVRLSMARRLLALGGDAHEIAIVFHDPVAAEDQTMSFWTDLSGEDNEALSWTKLLPQLEAVLELSRFSIVITGLILFGVVALGIINTLFMSLYERMFEFGVLRAVGTSPLSLMRLVVAEAGALALISIVLGGAIGFVLTLWVSHVGIDWSGIEYAGVTFTQKIYPLIQWDQYVKYPAWTFVLTTLVGIYPAFHAARVSPARAMRKSF